MAHMLRKDKKITFKPGHPSVPEYPGRPWLPARTAVEVQKVCGYSTSAQYSSIIPAATYTTSVTTPGTTTVETTSTTDTTKTLLTYDETKAAIGLTALRKVIFPYFGITLDANGNIPQGTVFVQPTLVLPMRGSYVNLADYNNAVTAAYAAYNRANTIYYAAKSGNVSAAMFTLFVTEAKTGWYKTTTQSKTVTTTTTTPDTTTYNTQTVSVPPPVGTGWIKVPANPLAGEPEKYIQVLLDKDGKPTSGAVSYNYVYSCVDKNVTVNYPEQSYIAPRAAIAGVPSQTIIDLNLGWNAGARSVRFLSGPGKVEFKVPQGVVGAVVGINDAGVDAGYTNIENAWYFSSGIARIYEGGVDTFYTGSYITGDVFGIKRINGIVSYWKNDALVHTSVSLNTADVFLDASLYAGDDLVYDPEFTELMFSENSLEPLHGSSGGHAIRNVCWSEGYFQPLTTAGGVSATTVGDGANVSLQPLDVSASGYNFMSGARSAASLRPLTGRSHPASRSNASFAPLVGLSSNRIYGQSATSLEPLEVETTGGMPMPSFSIANTAIMYLTGGGTGLSGEIGGSTASMPAIAGLSSGGSPDYIGSGTGNVTVVGNVTTVVVVNGDGTTTTATINTSTGAVTIVVTTTAGGAVVSTVTGTVIGTVVNGGTTTYTIANTNGTTAVVTITGSNGTITLITPVSYGESALSLHPLIGVSYAYEGNLNATMMTSIGSFGELSAPIERMVFMSSDMTMATFIAVQRNVNGEMVSTVQSLTEMEYQGLLNAVMRSVVMMSFGVPAFDELTQAWVVNATTGASSRYEDFPFNSFGKIGKRYYGCKGDGLYLLEGDSDDATPIRASVDFGNSDFGTSLLKSCKAAYFGLASSGRPFLKVTVDGKEYIYSARSSSENMRTERFDMGRGIRASYLRFELYNNNGSDFELDSVEFMVVPLGRRI